jgi:hypothetical protein
MNGTLFVRAGLTHWRSVTALMLLGISVTGLSAAGRTPEFRSHMQLVATFTTVHREAVARLAPANPEPPPAGAPPAVDPTSAVSLGHALGADERLLESRVRGLAQKATGVAVTANVRRELGLPYSADELGSRIAASSPLHTTLIDIEVRDTDRARATQICAAVGAALVTLADEEKLPDDDPAPLKVTLTVRLAASVPTSAEPVPWLRYLAGGAFGGLAVGVGLAVQRVLLRRRDQSMLGWAQNLWRERVAALRSLARRANERFWGPGWR